MQFISKLNTAAVCTGFVIVLNLFCPLYVNAKLDFFSTWQTTYPDSSSDDASCQLCHQNSAGGNGWNAYGWEIRGWVVENGNTIGEALPKVESSNSDYDVTASSNIIEINSNAQPGWASGSVNTIHYKDGTTLAGQSPPTLSTDIDPQKLQDPVSAGMQKGLVLDMADIATGFTAPNYATFAPGLNGYIFVVDQVGVLYQVNLESGIKTTFLDISGDLVNLGIVGSGTFDERGLLGLAFHPQYASNGLLYTYQSEPVGGTADFSTIPEGSTADHQSVIAEWEVTNPTNPLSVVNPDTKRVIMRIDQPQFNHDGGMLAIGPDDYLYISLGDGGGADDVDGQTFLGDPMIGHGDSNGQDATNPFGSILRIDPLGTNSTNGQYSNPSSNPFTAVDDSRLDEIFAYGFRNPFRFSFDTATGDLYVADVGQNDVEEVDLVVNGGNYGWNAKEGSFYFYSNGDEDGYVSYDISPTADENMIDPVLQYDHDESLSIIGGYVYRGDTIDLLKGLYVFGDWSQDFGVPMGRLFYSDNMQTIHEFKFSDQDSLGLFLNGFGQDENGELYIVGNTTGVPSGDTGVLRKITSAKKSTLCFPVSNKFGGQSIICF